MYVSEYAVLKLKYFSMDRVLMMRIISMFLLFADRQNYDQPLVAYECKFILQTGAQPLFEFYRKKSSSGLVDLLDHIMVKNQFDTGITNDGGTFKKFNVLLKRKKYILYIIKILNYIRKKI